MVSFVGPYVNSIDRGPELLVRDINVQSNVVSIARNGPFYETKRFWIIPWYLKTKRLFENLGGFGQKLIWIILMHFNSFPGRISRLLFCSG